jgi:predicted small integral membrane protein
MEEVVMFSAKWWTLPLGRSWMAWTPATASFFAFIVAAISAMGVWEYYRPGGDPRRGVFAIDTTRGDRLFISLLGSAFIFIGWMFFVGSPLWWPLGIALAWFVFVFRYV